MTTGGGLLERDHELELADRVLDRLTHDGTGSAVLFEGPAGIGKTSLLARVRVAGAARGFTVCQARGIDLEEEFAWGLLRQLFVPLTRPGGDGPAGRADQPPRNVALDVLAAGPDDLRPHGEYAMLNSLYWLASDHGAAAPLLLVADDLHWSDPASLRFLAYLAARLDGLPVAIVGALRPGGGRNEAVIAAIADSPHATTHALAPFSAAASAAMLAGILPARPAEELAARCHDLTRGNPLLLRELGRELSRSTEAGTLDHVLGGRVPSVARYIRGQLHRMPDAARSTIQALSVLGDRSTVDGLAAVAELPADTVLESLSALVDGELVMPSGVPEVFSISHPLVRAAIYDDAALSTRAGLHAQAARLAMADNDVERAAAHLLRLPARFADLDTVAILDRAADACAARGAIDGAVAYLRRQLDEDLDDDARHRLQGRLGLAEILVDAEQGRSRLVAAMERETDLERRAETAVGVVGATFFCGRPAEAMAVCRDALGDGEGLSENVKRALKSWIVLLSFLQPPDDYTTRVTKTIAQWPADDSLGGLMLDGTLALHAAFGCRPQETVERARRAIAHDVLLDHPVAESPLSCAWTALQVCDAPEALPSIESAIGRARATGSMRTLAPALCYRTGIMVARGDLDEAISDGRTAWEAANTSAARIGIPFVAGYLLPALVHTGHLDEAEAVLAQADASHPAGMPRYMYSEGAISLRLAQGRPADAYDAALLARDECLAYGMLNPLICGWQTHLVQCLHLQERTAEAREVAAEALAVARQLGTARAVGQALRTAAVAETGEAQLELLTESVRVLAGSPAKFELARSRYALGEALRRARRLADARAELQAALELSEVCGAAPLQEQVEAALRVSGGRRRAAAQHGPAALTAGETRVAELAARGLTNREIAQSLFVTVKTVEVHLGNTFRKLGIMRRQELGGAMD